jgi:hypothetical protein
MPKIKSDLPFDLKEPYFSTREAASFVGLSEESFRAYLRRGKGPRRVKHFGETRFYEKDLIPWRDRHVRVIPEGSIDSEDEDTSPHLKKVASVKRR